MRVTGRRKEILVTAGGKNVAPGVLEDRLRAHPLVSQCMVVGRRPPVHRRAGDPRPGRRSRAWAAQHGKRGDARRPAATTRTSLAEVQEAVDDANTAVSQAESIRRFAVLPVDWTEEAGELTPSLKLRRNVVMREFRREIADLYD